MSEHSKAPTAASTSPLGNTNPPPTPLAREISPNLRAKAKELPADQQRRMREHLALKAKHSGHARR